MYENQNIPFIQEEQYQICSFKNIVEVKKPYVSHPNSIFNSIRDGKYREQVEKVRHAKDKKEQHNYKKDLVSICFSGIFSERKKECLERHTGLIALDFDKVGESLQDFKDAICADQYTYACFISPSGTGLKVIVKIPPIIENHLKYFYGLKNYYQVDYWDDLKDITRVCYISYDPQIYVNPNSTVFTYTAEPQKNVAKDYSLTQGGKNTPNAITDDETIYANLRRWTEKSQQYVDGNKYNFLVALSSACNRFGIMEEFTIGKLLSDYHYKNTTVDPNDFYEIIRGVYVRYRSQFNTSHFNNSGQMVDFDINGKARDVIYLDDIEDAILRSYRYGEDKGTTTYFKTIDPHFKWRLGEVTLMNGIPNQGKTTMMLQLMLIKSVKEGVKWGIFSPEQNPPTDFYKDLVHTYIGKPADASHYHGMKEDELRAGMAFVKKHFFFIYPENDSATPKYINERFAELIIKHGIKGCVIDPFNQLENDFGKNNGRDDHYISLFLAEEKKFALKHNVYKIIIAHPKGGATVKADGNYACPGAYDLAGGAMWFNKLDNMLVTYRPLYRTDSKNPITEFESQKIKKQTLVGRPGTTKLYFNILTNRYEEAAFGEESGSISPFDSDYDKITSESFFYGDTPFENAHHLDLKKSEKSNYINTEVNFHDFEQFDLQDDINSLLEGQSFE